MRFSKQLMFPNKFPEHSPAAIGQANR